MCGCGGYGSLPYGIPIEKNVHNLLPEAVKMAYEVFGNWWDTVHETRGIQPVDESSMPEEVRKARELILETPIPGYEGKTCKDSCSMVTVQACFDLFKIQSNINS